MDTVRVFDEFPENSSELTLERRHQKRMRLEPLIFDILKQKYLPPLMNFYSGHTFPVDKDKCVVLIERRIHPNIFFLIRNIAYFARDWSLSIVCSDMNLAYCKECAGHAVDSITFLPLFNGNPTPEEGKTEYNLLLQTSEFYQMFSAEHLLCMETDSYLRKQIPEDSLEYDYVAAPYEWDSTLSGGGLSLRKRSAMIDICQRKKEKLAAQDIYICQGVNEFGYRMPEFMTGVTYISESCLYEDPFAVHQWWTFFFLDNEDPNYFFKCLTTLEL
jgi:Protein of unknown function (DUF5672)